MDTDIRRKETSSDSSNCGTIQINFIPAESSQLDDEKNSLLRKAFQTLRNQDIAAGWSNTADCLSIKRRTRNEVFVFAEFSGEAFEHLRALRCSIVGPSLVLSCLEEGKPMPKSHRPLLSDCMSGIVACCSNVKKAERDQIHDRILSMNGQVEGCLSTECTTLVTPEVGSRKYKEAAKQKPILIVTPSWIEEAWRRSHLEVFKAKDDSEMSTKYKCPIFAGLTITVSNVKNEQRKTIERLIKENGGKFSGEMKQGETTHLVTDSMESQKYKTAKRWTQWPVSIVNTAWLMESVKQGWCLDEEKFPTEKKGVSSPIRAARNAIQRQKCSTPNGGVPLNAAPPFVIPSDPDSNRTAFTTILPETTNTTVWSNVSLAATTHVNSSEMQTLPLQQSIQNRAETEQTVLQEESVSTTLTAKDTNLDGVLSPAPLKRIRSLKAEAEATATVSKSPAEREHGAIGSSSSKRARTTGGGASGTPSSFGDVLSQYMNGDAQDTNASFRPQFDIADALDYVEKVDKKHKDIEDESPSVIAERHLLAAVESTGIGSSYYNSPTVVADVRRSLAQRLQHVLGRSSFKRNGSNSGFSTTLATDIASPATSAACNVVSNGRTGHAPHSQDTPEEHVVDWDDPNQRLERQKVGGLLKKRNEPTQSVVSEEEDDYDDDDEDCQVTAKENMNTKRYLFQLTSVNKPDSDRYVDIIEKLGGSVSDSPNYDPQCTHLLAANPTRNEKLLTGMASGIWILHTKYLDACEEASHFVEEENYEFGSRAMSEATRNLRDEVKKLVRKCQHWRLAIREADGAKAYSGWNVLLTADKVKEEGLARILTNGGAKVTKSVTEAKEGGITHVIIDPGKKLTATATDLISRLYKAGVKCYKTDVIFGYLAGDNLDDFLYPIQQKPAN